MQRKRKTKMYSNRLTLSVVRFAQVRRRFAQTPISAKLGLQNMFANESESNDLSRRLTTLANGFALCSDRRSRKPDRVALATDIGFIRGRAVLSITRATPKAPDARQSPPRQLWLFVAATAHQGIYRWPPALAPTLPATREPRLPCGRRSVEVRQSSCQNRSNLVVCLSEFSPIHAYGNY